MSGIIGVSPDMRSGVVGKYPDGHVLQTENYLWDGANSVDGTNASGALVRCTDSSAGGLNYKGTIDNVGANNDVWITMSFAWNMNWIGSNADFGGGWGIFRETAIIMNAKEHQSYFYNTTSHTSENCYLDSTISFMDESPATGTNNYYLGFKSYSSTHIYIRSLASEGFSPFRCILQEIQR